MKKTRLILTLFLLPSLAGAAWAGSTDKVLAGLSLEEKVGQLFMIAIDTEIAGRYEPLIRKGRLGSALLRWDRFTGREVREFTAKLREWTDASPGKVPLIFAADHEGGPVFTQRLYGATVFPGNMALAASRNIAWAEEAAFITARELRSLGIQIDFAPVVDANTNPDNPIIGVRSFGEDPDAVADLSAAAIRGYRRGGVLPTAKHFPGHGNTAVNSHFDLPVIPQPLADWERLDLIPFKAAVKSRVPLVMTAHILVPALDPALPVTLSSAALQGFLRRKLGFDGVIVSDSLDMGAISKAYGMPEAAIRSLEAGCDILLVGKGDFPASYEKVLAAVKEGRISMPRIDESVKRILALKEAANLLGPARKPELAFEQVGGPAHQDLAQRIADASVTLLRNDESLLPLHLRESQALVVVMFRNNRFIPEAAGFRDELRRRHQRTQLIELAPQPDAQALDDAAKAARQGDVLVLGTYQIETMDNKSQAEFYGKLRTLGKPTIVVSLMNPYDLRSFPEAKTQLCAYGITPASLRALARIIFGEIKPRGQLPVSIPGFYKRGDGLAGFKAGPP